MTNDQSMTLRKASLLFINDLPLVLKNNIGIYADDSTLYASAPTLAEVEAKI